MDIVKKLLHEKFAPVTIITAEITKYMNLIKDIIISYNQQEYNDILKGIKYLDEFIINIDNIHMDTVDEILSKTSTLYQDFDHITDILKLMTQVIQNNVYSKYMIHNMSTSYVLDFNHSKDYVLSLNETYISKSLIIDNLLFDKILEMIDYKNNMDKVFEFIIENETIINMFVIKIITVSIGLVNPNKRRRLENIIENQKNIILDANRITLNYSGIQGLMIRYNLTPVTNSRSINDIFQLINLCEYDDNLSLKDNLKNLSKISSNGVICLSLITKSPIEFDIRGIIDMEYIIENNLKNTSISGINPKLIERFKTLTVLDKPKQPADKIICLSGKSNEYYIFATLNGLQYKLLSTNRTNLTRDTDIKGLINGLSLRPYRYNTLHEEMIIKSCFNNKYITIIEKYRNHIMSIPSSEHVKLNILDRLIQKFTLSINESPIKSTRDFKARIVNYSTISNILLIIFTKDIKSRNINSSEFLLTHIISIESLTGDFIKEIHRSLSKEKLNERIFAELSEAVLRETLISIYTNIITRAITEIDKNNTWMEYNLSLKNFFIDNEILI